MLYSKCVVSRFISRQERHTSIHSLLLNEYTILKNTIKTLVLAQLIKISRIFLILKDITLKIKQFREGVMLLAIRGKIFWYKAH